MCSQPVEGIAAGVLCAVGSNAAQRMGARGSWRASVNGRGACSAGWCAGTVVVWVCLQQKETCCYN